MEAGLCPYFSIVIPTYNSAETLDRALESIDKIEYPSYECIVVDDGSTDNTAETANNYDVQYIYQPNSGPAVARNEGVKKAQGDIILFVDADCVVPHNILHKYAEAFQDSEFIGVGGTYRTLNKEYAVARYVGMEIAFRHKDRSGIVNALGTYNAAFKKDIFERLGGFDTSYKKASGEDFDFSYRAVKHEYKLTFDNNIYI